MAKSPAHTLGQAIGNFIEQHFENELSEICNARELYLDVIGSERPARRGKKITWLDAYNNKHDLDFVIERGGTKRKIGTPAALIECAWRRYAKHSKNKAQEMQGAVLPVAENYSINKPFIGAVLAGVFTAPAVEQLKSHGFKVLYFKYDDVVDAFKSVDVDIRTTETTSDKDAQQSLDQIRELSDKQNKKVFEFILKNYKTEVEEFKRSLVSALDRQIYQIIVAPLYGTNLEFASIDEAIEFIENFSEKEPAENPEFIKVTVQVRYGNGDIVGGDFSTKSAAEEFLRRIT